MMGTFANTWLSESRLRPELSFILQSRNNDFEAEPTSFDSGRLAARSGSSAWVDRPFLVRPLLPVELAELNGGRRVGC